MAVAERRQREKEERRAAIIDAAEAVFRAKSVSAATMDDIAAAAELSKGTLYLYFDSKDELYLAVALRALAEVLEGFDVAFQQGGTGLERVARIARAYVAFATTNRDRFLATLSWLIAEYSVKSESERFSEYRRQSALMAKYAVDAIELGKQDGSIRADVDAPRLASQLWGSTVGVLLAQANAQDLLRLVPLPVDLDAVVPLHVALIFDAISKRSFP